MHKQPREQVTNQADLQLSFHPHLSTRPYNISLLLLCKDVFILLMSVCFLYVYTLYACSACRSQEGALYPGAGAKSCHVGYENGIPALCKSILVLLNTGLSGPVVCFCTSA